MTPRPRRMDLADYVNELTQPHIHREHYQVRDGLTWYGRNHITHVPSLLQQLWDNDTPSATTEDGPRPGYQSKPAARLDALDTAGRIDADASRWIRFLGEDDVHADTAATVRQLHGLAASASPTVRAAITADVRRWWTQARIVTGWDSPAWTPDNTCPQCGQRGTLRIRLAERLGMCTHEECRVLWDEATIGLLADHIRAESAAERGPVRRPGVCVCPWPRPVVPDLGVLCPSCGSASCTRALQARLVEQVRQTANG